MKKHCPGLTLIEILLSLVVLSVLIALFMPQLLRNTHEQAVNKTVSEINQIVLAARNYYQDKQDAMTSTLSNASYWPQTLSDLTTSSYLPPAALCSSWPATTTITGTTCGNHQPYVLFPSTNPSIASGRYDTSVVGIASDAYSKGGNFWGISITLPNAKIAEEVRQKVPFGTRCSITDLRNGVACTVTDANTTVTALVPRPAIFAKAQYSKEGLIQSMGSIQVCDNTKQSPYGQRYPPNGNNTTKPSCDSNSSYGGNDHNVVHIPIPTTGCDAGQTPVLFVYPLNFYWQRNADGSPVADRPFPGIALTTVKDSNHGWWSVTATESGQYAASQGSLFFTYIYLAYFTACASDSDPNKWDPSWFSGV